MSDNRTTELTGTDRLRELLDERGVKWNEATPHKTKWFSPVLNGPVAVSEWRGKLVLDAGYVNVTPEQAIAATLGSEFNPDGLPVGLTISDDGNLLNWRGENYVKQSTLGSGTLTAEQVRKTVEKHWHDLPAEYDMPEAAALPEFSYDWHAIADELNSRAERTCHIVKNSRKYVLSDGRELFDDGCSICNGYVGDGDNYCSNCGARIVGE